MRYDDISVPENYLADTPFNMDQFIEQVRLYQPELDLRDQWIRSGHRIADRYKGWISSYRLLGSYSSRHGRARVEALLIKPHPLLPLGETEAPALEFIREYQTENRVDAVFAALMSTTDESWRFIFAADTARGGIFLPRDLTSYIAARALKNYLKKSCSLSDAALDGYFSGSRLLYDDTAIKNKAKQVDEALEKVKVCDISAGTGSLLAVMGEKIASVRSDVSKYLRYGVKSEKEIFLSHYAENSLYATDLDAGALEILKLCSVKAYGKRVPDEHVVYGSILTEELFAGEKFDIIVTNPPHMRQEEFSPIKDSFIQSRVFHKSADLYCYYVPRAMELLNGNGCAGIIISNRWMRSEYGAPLRAYLAESGLTDILDYGNIPPTKELVTPLSALVVGGAAEAGKTIRVTAITDSDFDDISGVAENESFLFPRKNLSQAPWVFESDNGGIMQKITSIGIPLEQYVCGGIHRGILTGLNGAFVVDEETARDFISRDAKSKELLRPFAAGRNVKRYAAPSIKKYLIYIPKGFTDKRRGEAAPNEWFLAGYPVIAEHLQKFREPACARRDKGDYWWELRSCNYYDAFERVKIISPAIVKRISATMDTSGVFSNDKTSIIESDDYYLLGVLNSRLMDFYARRITTALLNEHFELKPANLASLPIKKISETNSFQTKLRDTIAENAKKLSEAYGARDERSDWTAAAERAINRAVYRLYKLTPKEVNLVENN